MDIDTTPPPTHRDNRPTMQLDLPSADEVMMEVDPDFSLMSTPLTPLRENPPPAAAPATNSPQPQQQFPANAQAAPNSRTLDSGSAQLRFLPTPPVAIISTSDTKPWPKLKLDQLFVEWLARPESKSWLNSLLDDVRSGKTPEMPHPDTLRNVSKSDRSLSPGPSRSPGSSAVHVNISPQQPGSPISRLFRSHIPFGDSDSSPRSPPATPQLAVPAFKASSGASFVAVLDLEKAVIPNSAACEHPSPVTPSACANPAESTANAVHLNTSNAPDTLKVQSSVPSAATAEMPLQSSDALKDSPATTTALKRVEDGIAGMSAAQPSSVMVDSSNFAPGADIGEEKLETTLSGFAPLQEQQDAIMEIRDSEVPETSSQSSDSAAVASSEIGKETSSQRVQSQVSVPGEARPVGVDPASAPTAVSGTEVAKTSAAEDSRAAPEVSDMTGNVPDDTQRIVSAACPPPSPRSAPMDQDDASENHPRPKRKSLPRFYFPCGKDSELREARERKAMREFFKVRRNQKKLPGVTRVDFSELVVEVVGLPSYFGSIIFNAILELYPTPPQTVQQQATGVTPEEDPMRDVAADPVGAVADGSASAEGVASTQMDAGGTNSDTTMDDASNAVEEPRANGFHDSVNANAAPDHIRDVTLSVPNPDDGLKQEYICEEQLTAYYGSQCAGRSKESRLFFALKERSADRDYLVPSDFKPLLRSLLMCHQGLAFLHATPEFQQRYSETVIERIYFGCTRQHNGRLTLHDVKRAKLLDTLMVVDEEEDINRERRYFSYEHFYVLYCRFWELDANHDLQIDKEDLMRYGSHSLTSTIVDRIFQGYARPLDTPENPGYMSYTDFIWFCLSEEDKTSDTAIDYWFRCVDMDGDGLITMYDMEYFYKEQLHRMETFGHEPVQIKDILCQLLDMINPNMQPPVIRRRDLKRCRLAGNFFNVLFNINKFFAIEARDPIQIRQERATPDLTDWDRFAAFEYLRLSSDEEAEEEESWEEVGEAANPLMSEAPF